MTLTRIPAALLLTFGPFFCAFGQTGWTLDQCIVQAKARSPHLLIAKNFSRASDLSRQEVSTGKLPQVKFAGVAVYAPTFKSFGYDRAISDGGQYIGQLVIQQPVYDGGIRRLRIDQSMVDAEQRLGEFRRAERDLLFAVRQTFVGALLAQREVELGQESVRQLDEYLDVIRRLAKGGTASSTDVLKTNLQLSNARIALQRAEESAGAFLFSLKEIIGLPADTSFTVAGTIESLVIEAADSLTGRAGGGLAGNLDLSLSELELSRSLLDVELTRHETNPTVSLVADAGLVTSGDNLRLPADEREPIMGASIGVNVEIPLFNGGATDLRVQQKQIVTENLRLEHTLLQRSLDARSQTLHLQLAGASQRLQTARMTIGGAEENFLLTKAKFAGGAALSLEVLSAQQLLVESKLAEIQALADIQIIRARIDQLLVR